MGRITGVCLNPCIDKIVEIASFEYGGLNRILRTRSDGAGKGVNIALAARTLGHEGTCLGFLYEENGEIIESRLREAGAEAGIAWAGGAVRTNLKIYDRSTQRITEVNESGLAPSSEQIKKLEVLVDEYADKSSVMVFTGSLPPGLPKNYYARLMQIVNGRCMTVLDAEGEKLLSGLQYGPRLIKPNSYELELVTGRKLQSLQEIRMAAQELLEKGAGLVAVSMGSDGAMLVAPSQAWYAPRVEVEVQSTVGAGDSMVVGLLHGLLQELPLSQVLRMGAAAGTAAVVTQGTQLFDRDGFEEMLGRVQIEKL